MEHDDRAPVATFLTSEPLVSQRVAVLGEAQAHHARVKRLEQGDVVRLTDGSGHVATGTITALRKSGIEITPGDVSVIPKPAGIHVRVPIGDRDRMLWLAEKATELGITTWQAVRFRRSMSVSPRGEGAAFAEKVRARMVSALEQSGGAWMPVVLPDIALETLSVDAGGRGIVLDVGGAPLAALASLAVVDTQREPVILFGPEGGVDPDERELLHSTGWTAASLASTTLRFETAGIAAIAVVRGAQLAATASASPASGESANG